jgi:excisionase family DNA binding protein
MHVVFPSVQHLLVDASMIVIQCPCCGERVRFVNVQEAAERAKVNQATVKRWIYNGVLPSKKLSERMRIIRIDHLREFLKDRSRAVPNE